MVLFALCYIKFGFEWKTLFSIVICSTLLIMTMTDLKEKLVDCNIAIGLAIVGLLYNGFVNNTWLDSIYGLIAGAIIMEILARLGYLIKKERAFGEADTYVPCEMTRRTYDACRTDKCILTVPGAGHVMSILIDQEGVVSLTNEFLAKYCP